jgi:hypothetical protein
MAQSSSTANTKPKLKPRIFLKIAMANTLFIRVPGAQIRCAQENQNVTNSFNSITNQLQLANTQTKINSTP